MQNPLTRSSLCVKIITQNKSSEQKGASMEKQYLCIDLKSFYASVECVERGLDPLTTNLVVADISRTEKTICLAVSPSLKKHGVPGRPRLFDVISKIKQANLERLRKAKDHTFRGASADDRALQADPSLAIDYIVAPPRMAHYMEYSAKIYGIYLRYVAPEDIFAYSIDEVFMDVTAYLRMCECTAHEYAIQILRDVVAETGITATAGIGSNLYLAKIAMDITAKRMQPDKDGVRIASLDEYSYRKTLWEHRPLTDFWRVGKGISQKLEANGLYTMGDVAKCSLEPWGEDRLYKLFGVNAELLIDHAWGWESCSMQEIKSYRPAAKSLGSGQVLQHPYTGVEARVVVREMAEQLAYDLVKKNLVTQRISLTIGYDTENLSDPQRAKSYSGSLVWDPYGRPLPKPSHGVTTLPQACASVKRITQAATELLDRILDGMLLVRRIQITAEQVVPASACPEEPQNVQLEMFVDYPAQERLRQAERMALEQEQRLQKTVLRIKEKYGKNILLRGTSFQGCATARERNRQIGGHLA